MTAPSDPFSLVHSALWDLALGSSAVTALVKPNNRIRFDLDTQWNNIKDEAQDADYPELSLEVVSLTGSLRDTSSSSTVTRQYQFGIVTGSVQANYRLLPLEFALYAALANWVDVLTPLRWPATADRAFVTRANLVSAEQGRTDVEKQRKIQGWIALWTCEVRMDFKTSDLIAYGAGT